MIEKSTRRLFYGGLVHATDLTTLQCLARALLAVNEDGAIDWIIDDVDPASLQEAALTKGWSLDDVDFVELSEGEFLCPGFVDTHTHAPQYPNMGAGQQYELLDWLANVTFPTEARFADVEYAKKTYNSVVQRVLNCGTTTCCYYGSLHLEATKALADICHAKGQRAFVGKCNMDRNASPSYQEGSAEQSLAETQALITHISSLSSPLVQTILTPRFAIACSDTLLSGLGSIAWEHPDMAIQTHISENKSEVAFTAELFPSAPHYAGVYDAFGLLRKKTILAHGVLLTDDELALIKEREAGVSHCPTSNFNLRSGMAKVGEMLDRGIKVGLGTDVSGGYSPSILTAIQHASICSKMVSLQPTNSSGKFSGKQLPIATLLYLATMGGADLCGLASTVGNFTPGKEFDALLVDMRSGGEGVWYEGGDDDELDALLEKFLFCGDSRNVAAVWVKNRLVGGARK